MSYAYAAAATMPATMERAAAPRQHDAADDTCCPPWAAALRRAIRRDTMLSADDIGAAEGLRHASASRVYALRRRRCDAIAAAISAPLAVSRLMLPNIATPRMPAMPVALATPPTSRHG